MIKGKKISRLYDSEQRYGYLMISPVVLGFCALLVFPLLYEVYMSLTDMKLTGEGQFIGLQNYADLFNDPKYVKPYAEKLLIVEDGQITPYHFHWSKMEDIINRGGADLIVKVYNSTGDGRFADTDVDIYMDGRHFTVAAGSTVRIKPGESITLQTGMYHSFWAEGGKVLLGEVSKVNDDRVDNRFYESTGRFPEIEEDEKPLYLLGNEYPVAK